MSLLYAHNNLVKCKSGDIAEAGFAPIVYRGGMANHVENTQARALILSKYDINITDQKSIVQVSNSSSPIDNLHHSLGNDGNPRNSRFQIVFRNLG